MLHEDNFNQIYNESNQHILFENIYRESVLREIFVKDDFLNVINSAIEKSKSKNDGNIDKNFVLDKVRQVAKDFTKGEKTENGRVRRWLDFMNGEPVYFMDNIDYNNSKKRELAQEQNRKEFEKWLQQGVPEIQKLIDKHKGDIINIDGTTDTIQGSVNIKFIRDCFIAFLNSLANNNPDTYKFVKPVKDINCLK